MKIATFSIGDELLSGRVIDSNAAEIAAGLRGVGVNVRRHLAVGDRLEEIVIGLRELGESCDVVIVTGGLGPTEDDLTVEAAARAAGCRLVVSEAARTHARQMAGKLDNLLFTPLKDKQALLPEGAIVIPNPTGTASGFILPMLSARMFFLPGVPSEMRVMLRETVLPQVAAMQPADRVILSRHFNVFGPCEAEVDQLVSGIARPEQGLQLGICVSYPAMRIILTADADSDSAAENLLEPAAGAIRQRLGLFIYSEGERTPAEAVANHLQKRGLTLSLAESCTGGLISRMITDVAGSSRFFLEGAVTYSNAAKARILGVPEQLLERYGAVSSECAEAMADGVRRASGSSLGLSVTGIAGPDGGSDDKPVGTVFMGLSGPDGCRAQRFQFSGSREQIRTMTAWYALDQLRRYPDLSGR